MNRAHRTALDLRRLRPADPTRSDRTAAPARGPAATEWTRRALGGWEDPDMVERFPPTRMEIESETGVDFFRGALNALAFSFVLAALVGLYLIGG